MLCLLKIEADTWQLEIVGRLPALPPFLAYESNARVEIRGNSRALALNPLTGQLEPVVNNKSYPLFFENSDYDVYIIGRAEVSIEFPLPTPSHYSTENMRHYRVNFRNDVGLTEITVGLLNDMTIVRIEVFPIKIDYRADYLQIRDEISLVLRNLAFATLVRTFGQATSFPSPNPTLIEWLALITGYFDRFIAAAQAISLNPYSRLMQTSRSTRIDRARKLSPAAMRQAFRQYQIRPTEISSRTTFHSPEHISELTSRLSFDTQENRYFKAVLLEIRSRLKKIILSESSGDEDSDISAERQFFRLIRPQATRMLRRVEQVLAAPFLKEVSKSTTTTPNSLVMHMHPQYAIFRKFARAFTGGLSLAGGPLKIGIKNVALLYEYWCFLKIADLLRKSLTLSDQSIIRVKHLGLTVVLAKGKESTIEFQHPTSRETIKLTYNRRFNNLPTFRQVPDNVIRLTSDFDLFVFDAKYRMAFDHDYQDVFNGIGPVTDDIETMHRYRDAIVAKEDGGVDYVRVVRGGVILFPLPFEENYTKHRFYKSIDSIGIGGLPFLPRTTRLVEEFISSLLKIDDSSETHSD